MGRPLSGHDRSFRRGFCAIAGTFAIALLAGCVQQGPVRPVAPPPPRVENEPQAPHAIAQDQPGYLRLSNTPTDHVPIRVGVLLPFSNGSAATRALATAMLHSAELAVFESGNPDIILMPADEGVSAAEGARKLLAQGAEIIIGPLFASSVSAVAPIARDRGVPVLAFSTDRGVAGHGVYLLSFQPENEVRRVVGYAARQGRTSFAALVPRSAYGDHVAEAFRKAVTADGGKTVTVERFDPELGGNAALSDDVARANPDAVLIAQGGTLLKGIGSILSAKLDTSHSKLLGTGLWDDPSILQEPALYGGWFASPAPNAQDSFNAKYRNVFETTPPPLATLAYDAISLVALLGSGEPYRRFTRATLTDPNGFAGVDGIFRFNRDGTAERGLAILEVRPGGFRVIDRAPATFQTVGE
jgi:branched-chain amino acid transport system substrate-binding protein